MLDKKCKKRGKPLDLWVLCVHVCMIPAVETCCCCCCPVHGIRVLIQNNEVTGCFPSCARSDLLITKPSCLSLSLALSLLAFRLIKSTDSPFRLLLSLSSPLIPESQSLHCE